MQYILTEEEYDQINRTHAEIVAELRKTINELCMTVADTNPTFKGWDGKEDPVPWGCIHSDQGPNCGYCDECPVERYCTLDKGFSK